MESLGVSLPNLPSLPQFFFHYVLCILCVLYLISIAILKFNYYYWYHQPLTFRFSVRRFWTARRPNTFTSTMNLLRGGGGGIYNAAVVYPFITNVNYENVRVYSTASVSISRISPDIPFDEIAELLNKDHKVVVNNGAAAAAAMAAMCPYIHHERLACMLANETHGLAAFVGVYRSTASMDIHGVCILTPRIKIERYRVSSAVSGAAPPPLSTTIYVCEHLAWSRYNVSDRQSLELLETTEYIQKSREIAGEQTLYRYNEIPWFVIPFTTVYTYSLSLGLLWPVRGHTAGHTAIIKVSSVNFALFYAFINECSRDFSCSILNEITHLQHLIQSGIYQVYMLVLNKTRVLSVYIYGPSWARASPESLGDASKTHRNNNVSLHKKNTRPNRIKRLHNYISQTSTAVVKYLPPVIAPKYDLSGKRVVISRGGAAGTRTVDGATDTLYNPACEIPRLLSSIRNKQHCDTQVFVDGFIDSLKMRSRDMGPGAGLVLIDTIAHNYIIIDEIVRSVYADAAATPVLWSHKWHYILYNATIHREIPCKDLFMV